MKRALILMTCGCSLVRNTDDVIVGNGTGDSAIDSVVMDSFVPMDSAAMDAATDSIMDTPTTMEDRSWALWRMPSLTPTGYMTDGEVVTDTLTKLSWQKTASGPATYDEAVAACKSPWRLPYRIELVSLLAISMGNKPAINASAFPATPNAKFWTASTLATGGRYVVNFETANVESALGTEKYSYRCVRSP
jgi:hypothetical protein